MIIVAALESALGSISDSTMPVVIQDSDTGDFYDINVSKVDVYNEHGQTRTVLVLSAGAHRYSSPQDVAWAVSAQID